MTALSTPLCELLGIRLPVLQAPAGSIAGAELASAVSRAGGLGSMGATWLTESALLAQIEAVKATTPRPFMVNYALAFPPNTLSAALRAGVPVVTFSWGDPTRYIREAHAFGAIVGVQTTSAEGARRMVEAGADFLICQGNEAGGHVQSVTPLWELTPQIVAASGKTPVVAAGGLATGADMAKAFSLGAQGAVFGTRFVASQESLAHEIYKQRLVAAKASDTALTVCFNGGWEYAAHRVIRNSAFREWEAAGSPPAGKRPGEGETVGYSASGEAIFRYEDVAPRVGMTGSVEAMCLYAGTSCERIDDIPSAAEIVARLVAEFEALGADFSPPCPL